MNNEINRVELAAELLVTAVGDPSLFKSMNSKDIVTKCFTLADEFADEMQRRAEAKTPRG